MPVSSPSRLACWLPSPVRPAAAALGEFVGTSQPLVRAAKIQRDFARMDADGSGYLHAGEFRKALNGIRAQGEITIILIGHRLSTVASADRIAVLQEGVVTEVGTHVDLTRQCGWYAEAFEKQRDQALHAVGDVS